MGVDGSVLSEHLTDVLTQEDRGRKEEGPTEGNTRHDPTAPFCRSSFDLTWLFWAFLAAGKKTVKRDCPDKPMSLAGLVGSLLRIVLPKAVVLVLVVAVVVLGLVVFDEEEWDVLFKGCCFGSVAFGRSKDLRFLRLRNRLSRSLSLLS